MSRYRLWGRTPAILSLLALGFWSGRETPGAQPFSPMGRAVGGLSIPFVESDGQVDETVRYYARTFAGTVFLTGEGEIVYSLPAAALVERFSGGRAVPLGLDRSPTGVGSFRGDDPAQWRPHMAAWNRVAMGEVWPGIAVTVRAYGDNLEKVFEIAPGAAPERIRMEIDGAVALRVGEEGTLIVRTTHGDVQFTAPVAYQQRPEGRRNVEARYRIDGNAYGFELGTYDAATPLVIDPLIQATYAGGGGTDWAHALSVTSDAVYLAGDTASLDFPGTIGGAQANPGGGTDAFVALLTADLSDNAPPAGGSGAEGGGCGLLGLESILLLGLLALRGRRISPK